MNNQKKDFYKKINLTILGIFILIVINYIIDPFQQYRKPNFYKISNWRGDERYLNSGLIKNTEFDSILIGSSMTRNFDTEIIDKLTGWKTLKLTMSAATQSDIKKTFNFAKEKGTLKNVLMGIDIVTFDADIDSFKISYPEYMYSHKGIEGKNNLKYLINISILKQSVLLIKNNYFSKIEIEKKYRLGYLYNYSKNIVLKKNEKIIKLDYDIKDEISEKMIKNYQANLKSILDENSDKQFKLFFPPYSILYYGDLIENKKINQFISFKKYLVNELKQYPNVEIYDFQDNEKITHNLDNYGDKMHFSPQVSQNIFRNIIAEEEKIHVKNIDVKLSNLIKQLKNININKL